MARYGSMIAILVLLSSCTSVQTPLNNPTATQNPIIPSATSGPTQTATTISTATAVPQVVIDGVGEVSSPEAQIFDSAISDYKKAYFLPDDQAVPLTLKSFSSPDGAQINVAVTSNDIPLVIKNAAGKWKIPGYRDLAPESFWVGSEINNWTGPNLKTQAYVDTFLANFNSVTPAGTQDQNLYSKIPQGQKLSVEDVIGLYDWSMFDDVMKFTHDHQIPTVIQHIFPGFFDHSQAPEWMRQMSDQELKDWIIKHEEAFASHLSQVGIEPVAISVVNELMWHAADQNNLDQVWLEGSYLYSRLHDDFIQLAFENARKLWPNAVLFLNDDNSTNGEQTNTPLNAEAKVEFEYIKKMREAGVPIDAFGEQAHLLPRNFLEGSGTPGQNIETNIASYKQQLADLIRMYKQINVKVYITELDANIGGLPADWTVQQKEALKARLYGIVFETALASGNCDFVTTWGFTNASSWVINAAEYPYKPGESPLPYDAAYKPTQSVFEIRKVLLSFRLLNQ